MNKVRAFILVFAANLSAVYAGSAPVLLVCSFEDRPFRALIAPVLLVATFTSAACKTQSARLAVSLLLLLTVLFGLALVSLRLSSCRRWWTASVVFCQLSFVQMLVACAILNIDYEWRKTMWLFTGVW